MMNTLPRLFCFFVLLAASLCSSVVAEEGFRPLFNGKDLTGWVNVNTAPSTWSIKDGMLACTGKPIGEIRTDRMYQNFILELEWQHLRPKGNAGVFIWADDITAKGQPFHRGIEVQVLENEYGKSDWFTTHGDIFPIHGATMTPINGRGGSRAFPTEERSRPSPEWNHYRIECIDGNISLAVNGKVVTRGTDCSPRKGYICLESEGGIVNYRNVRIKELPDSPIEEKHVAIANRGYRCLYSGVDLAGWKTETKRTQWKSQDWVLAFRGESSTNGDRLTTVESFGDYGFIFDVRLKENSGVAKIRLRGAESAEIAIDPADPKLANHLDIKGWNRFEGTLQGDQLNLTLNGHPILADQTINIKPTAGPIQILPGGPIDWANIYVRSLQDK